MDNPVKFIKKEMPFLFYTMALGIGIMIMSAIVGSDELSIVGYVISITYHIKEIVKSFIEIIK